MPKIDLTNHFQTKTEVPWVELTKDDQLQLTMYETARDVYFREVINAMLVFPEINDVFDGIHIGTALAAEDVKLLRALEISYVINMTKDEDYYVTDDVTMTKVGIQDGEMAPDGVFSSVAEMLNILHKTKENVLVHCSAGVSRSTTAVLSYLMRYHDIGFLDALRQLQRSRKPCSPHPLLIRSMIRDLGENFSW